MLFWLVCLFACVCVICWLCGCVVAWVVGRSIACVCYACVFVSGCVLLFMCWCGRWHACMFVRVFARLVVGVLVC